MPVKALGVGLFKAASVERSKTVKSDCAGSVFVIDCYAFALGEFDKRDRELRGK